MVKQIHCYLLLFKFHITFNNNKKNQQINQIKKNNLLILIILQF